MEYSNKFKIKQDEENRLRLLITKGKTIADLERQLAEKEEFILELKADLHADAYQVKEINRLRDELDHRIDQQFEVNRLRDGLRKAEQSMLLHADTYWPCCGGEIEIDENGRAIGHKPDCWLAKLLGGEENQNIKFMEEGSGFEDGDK